MVLHCGFFFIRSPAIFHRQQPMPKPEIYLEIWKANKVKVNFEIYIADRKATT